ncbi:unnamed protein product [Bursaphelenchus okinawaensis]|uniref:Partial AB-hydrolase lipase domain-containing protein n=1 Tax=Bursaphelenchus okinawaensis TaxID=465554 RepID=A0A811KDJ3_9BILA|nr:unnamed protein product [Bursaphelenchus okinawaensis]CAG9102685.1 unnamed protein product [Bursaphelenchus okinawaensis]
MGLKIVFCLLAATVAGLDLKSLYLPEQGLDAMGLIEYWGYEGEEYIAETEDGWLLPIHRIPRGINETGSNPNKPVVILQHGLECASDNFLLNLPHQSPGFVFADAGYDVWMPNSRGNTYAKNKYYNSYICDTNEDLAIGQSICDLTAYAQFSLGLLSQTSFDILTALTCVTPAEREYCAQVFYWFGGPSTTTNVMPIYTNHIPAGASTATVQKYCQSGNLETGGFKWYKYPTAAENIARYGQEEPPYYNLTKMEVPLYLYSTPEDYLTTLVQLEDDILPNLAPGVLQEDNRYPGFSHMDFLWGLNATEMVYNKVIDDINADYE